MPASYENLRMTLIVSGPTQPSRMGQAVDFKNMT